MNLPVAIALMITLAGRVEAQPTPKSVIATEKPKFHRRTDPILIQGESVADLLGAPLEHYLIFSDRTGEGWQTLPFQIDERDSEGRYVMTAGKTVGTDPQPGLDVNDEIVLMAGDLGRRVLPEEADFRFGGSRHWVELELVDPRDGSAGYAYLVLWGEGADSLASDIDYLCYDPKIDMIYAENYEIGYLGDKDLVYYTHIAVPESAGGTGIDMIDRFMARVELGTWLANFSFDEDEVRSIVIGYVDGPVRILRRVENSVNILLGIHAFYLEADMVYYRDSHVAPAFVHIPFRLDSIARSATVTTGTDYSPEAWGMKYYNNNNPNGFTFDGVMSEAEKNIDKREYDWAYATGKHGTIVNRVKLYKELGHIPYSLFYLDDKETVSPPEDFPGRSMSGSWGNLLDLPAGDYRFDVLFYFPAFFNRERDLPDILAVEDAPLQLRVNAPDYPDWRGEAPEIQP